MQRERMSVRIGDSVSVRPSPSMERRPSHQYRSKGGWQHNLQPPLAAPKGCQGGECASSEGECCWLWRPGWRLGCRRVEQAIHDFGRREDAGQASAWVGACSDKIEIGKIF